MARLTMKGPEHSEDNYSEVLVVVGASTISMCLEPGIRVKTQFSWRFRDTLTVGTVYFCAIFPLYLN